MYSLFTNIDEQFVLLFKFAHRKTKEPFVSITNRSLVGTLITIGDVTASIAIDVMFWLLVYGKIVLGFGHCKKMLTALQLLHFFTLYCKDGRNE